MSSRSGSRATANRLSRSPTSSDSTRYSFDLAAAVILGNGIPPHSHLTAAVARHPLASMKLSVYGQSDGGTGGPDSRLSHHLRDQPVWLSPRPRRDRVEYGHINHRKDLSVAQHSGSRRRTETGGQSNRDEPACCQWHGASIVRTACQRTTGPRLERVSLTGLGARNRPTGWNDRGWPRSATGSSAWRVSSPCTFSRRGPSCRSTASDRSAALGLRHAGEAKSARHFCARVES